MRVSTAEVLGEADGLAEVLGEAEAVGEVLGTADAVAVGGAGTGAVAGFCGAGGLVSWVFALSAGTEVGGAAAGCPIPRMKYAEAAVAAMTANIPIPIRIKGNFELEAGACAAEVVAEDWATGEGSVLGT